MVGQVYPSELQHYKVNTSDTEAAFFDLHLSISNDIVSTKIIINVTTALIVMINCVLPLSHVVSWVRCGASLYRSLIIIAILT